MSKIRIAPIRSHTAQTLIPATRFVKSNGLPGSARPVDMRRLIWGGNRLCAWSARSVPGGSFGEAGKALTDEAQLMV